MQRQIMNYPEYEAVQNDLYLNCQCGWQGKAQEAFNELYNDVLDFECPECENTLLIVDLVIRN